MTVSNKTGISLQSKVAFELTNEKEEFGELELFILKTKVENHFSCMSQHDYFLLTHRTQCYSPVTGHSFHEESG